MELMEDCVNFDGYIMIEEELPAGQEEASSVVFNCAKNISNEIFCNKDCSSYKCK